MAWHQTGPDCHPLRIICVFGYVSCHQRSPQKKDTDIELNHIVAIVDTKSIPVGQKLKYSILVCRETINLPKPKLPELTNFTVLNAGQSTSLSFVNSKVSCSKKYNYTLIPKKEGELTIGSSWIAYNGIVYKTEPITITATKASQLESAKKRKKSQSVKKRSHQQKDTDIELNSIVAIVDTKSIPVGQKLKYSILVCRETINLPKPKLPELTNFTVLNAGQSSSLSSAHGKLSRSSTYNYTLTPKKEGELTIGSSWITYNNNAYKTEPITITATKTSQLKPTQKMNTSPFVTKTNFFKLKPVKKRKKSQSVKKRSQQPKDTATEIFIKTIVNKKNAQVNEPIILTYKLYYRNVTPIKERINWPDFSGFLTKDVPLEKKRKKKIKMIDGKKFYTIELYKKILFATTPGIKYIKKATFNFLFKYYFLIGQKKQKIESNPITINIKK